MAQTSTKKLIFVFKNQQGGNVSFTIEDPKEGLTSQQVATVMDTIISKNIFSSKGGNLVSKQDIRLVDTTTNDIYQP